MLRLAATTKRGTIHDWRRRRRAMAALRRINARICRDRAA